MNQLDARPTETIAGAKQGNKMKALDEIKQMMAAGDTAKAAEALKELLAKEPRNLQAKMLYGTCCQLLGDEETFKRIHDELAPEMKYTIVFHDETTEFGVIKTLWVYLQVLIDAIALLVIAMAAILVNPLYGVILGAVYAAGFWYARTNNKSEPCLKRESKMEPGLAADGCREDNECWICGDKCDAGEAFQVKMSGNCVKHVEQMFLHTTIRKAWQSVIVDVPCCHHCLKSIEKSKSLHRGGEVCANTFARRHDGRLCHWFYMLL